MSARNNFMSRFPGSRMIFLYRNLKETVDSFMRVMASFQRYASLFTTESEMLGKVHSFSLNIFIIKLPKLFFISDKYNGSFTSVLYKKHLLLYFLLADS
jgi:hypothetical protein